MQVVSRVKGYKQDPNRYFHFKDYESECGDFVLIEAGFSKPLLWDEYGFAQEKLSKIKRKKIVRIEFDEPNKFFVGDYPYDYDKDFYKIFTICPYTAKWLDHKFGEKKRIPIFFPISERYIYPAQHKTFDVLYSGHILSGELKNELMNLTQFNYALVSNSADSIVTHRSISYEEKMKLYAQSKVTLVHNVIFKTYFHRLVSVWLSGDFWNNKAFVQLPRPWKPWEIFRNWYVPQLKSRAFEAAVSKSLILCRRDPFRILERYFEPGKEFIYYEPKTLTETLHDILRNYSSYKHVINRAYNRAVKNYTVRAFVEKYLKKIK